MPANSFIKHTWYMTNIMFKGFLRQRNGTSHLKNALSIAIVYCCKTSSIKARSYVTWQVSDSPNTESPCLCSDDEVEGAGLMDRTFSKESCLEHLPFTFSMVSEPKKGVCSCSLCFEDRGYPAGGVCQPSCLHRRWNKKIQSSCHLFTKKNCHSEDE